MKIEEEARLLINTFQDGLDVGVKHYHPETGDLLLTVKDILEALSKHQHILIDFGSSGLNRAYAELLLWKITEQRKEKETWDSRHLSR